MKKLALFNEDVQRMITFLTESRISIDTYANFAANSTALRATERRPCRSCVHVHQSDQE